jgi:para-nitrobenzyl esterase
VLVLKEPGDVFLAGEQARVNYLVGATDCEMCGSSSFFDPVGWLSALRTRRELIGKFFPASEQLVREAYAGDAKRHFLSDPFFVEPSKLTAGLAQRAKQVVFVYRFSYVPKHLLGTEPGASHSAELPFVFDQLIERYLFSVDRTDQVIATMMHAYWVNFAKTGNPNGSGLPAWPPYDQRSDIVMVLGPAGIEAKSDPAKARLDVLSRAHDREPLTAQVSR